MITEDSRNILVADDSLFFRTKLSDILVEAGHKVRFARDGSEVIHEIEAHSDDIDLIMLDLQMPDIDGFAVLKWLKENGLTGSFPVLAITGVYEPGAVMDRLRGVGATGLMTKGASPEEIIFRVNRMLFRKKASEGAQPRTRVPASLPADFTVGESVQTGFILNISESGVYLHTKYELLAGSMVNLRFSLPGSSRVVDVKGMVRWTTSDIASKTMFGGGGVMFTTIDTEDQAEIASFVKAEAERLGISEGGDGGASEAAG